VLNRSAGQIDKILSSGAVNTINLSSTCQKWDGLTQDASGRLWFVCGDIIPGTTNPSYLDYGVLDPATGKIQIMYTDDSNALSSGDGLAFGSDDCLYSEVLKYTNNTPNGLIRKYCTHL
jgi:hypothetical protein